MQTPNSDHLQEKWAPLLDYEGLDPIKDPHRRAVTAALLENQEQAIREEREFLSEAAPTNSTASNGATAGFSAGAGSPTAPEELTAENAVSASLNSASGPVMFSKRERIAKIRPVGPVIGCTPARS